MEQWLVRWLDIHRLRRLLNQPPRGYMAPPPIDEEQLRQQAIEGRAWIKEQQQ